MKPISLFQKYWSYIRPIEIERTGSAYNPQLNVVIDRGEYQLCTADAIYSYGKRYDNFRLSFQQINLEHQPIQSVLLLGLGLGSIPYLLEKTFGKKYEYVAIDIDGVVIELAHDYVLSALDSYLEAVECDGLHFLNLDERKFDFIAMDIFQSATIPAKYQSREYLELLQSKLNPGGLLMYNRLDISEEDQNINKAFLPKFKEVFDSGTSLKVKFNQMFINDDRWLK